MGPNMELQRARNLPAAPIDKQKEFLDGFSAGSLAALREVLEYLRNKDVPFGEALESHVGTIEYVKALIRREEEG